MATTKQAPTAEDLRRMYEPTTITTPNVSTEELMASHGKDITATKAAISRGEQRKKAYDALKGGKYEEVFSSLGCKDGGIDDMKANLEGIDDPNIRRMTASLMIKAHHELALRNGMKSEQGIKHSNELGRIADYLIQSKDPATMSRGFQTKALMDLHRGDFQECENNIKKSQEFQGMRLVEPGSQSWIDSMNIKMLAQSKNTNRSRDQRLLDAQHTYEDIVRQTGAKGPSAVCQANAIHIKMQQYDNIVDDEHKNRLVGVLKDPAQLKRTKADISDDIRQSAVKAQAKLEHEKPILSERERTSIETLLWAAEKHEVKLPKGGSSISLSPGPGGDGVIQAGGMSATATAGTKGVSVMPDGSIIVSNEVEYTENPNEGVGPVASISNVSQTGTETREFYLKRKKAETPAEKPKMEKVAAQWSIDTMGNEVVTAWAEVPAKQAPAEESKPTTQKAHAPASDGAKAASMPSAVAEGAPREGEASATGTKKRHTAGDGRKGSTTAVVRPTVKGDKARTPVLVRRPTADKVESPAPAAPKDIFDEVVDDAFASTPAHRRGAPAERAPSHSPAAANRHVESQAAVRETNEDSAAPADKKRPWWKFWGQRDETPAEAAPAAHEETPAEGPAARRAAPATRTPREAAHEADDTDARRRKFVADLDDEEQAPAAARPAAAATGKAPKAAKTRPTIEGRSDIIMPIGGFVPGGGGFVVIGEPHEAAPAEDDPVEARLRRAKERGSLYENIGGRDIVSLGEPAEAGPEEAPAAPREGVLRRLGRKVGGWFGRAREEHVPGSHIAGTMGPAAATAEDTPTNAGPTAAPETEAPAAPERTPWQEQPREGNAGRIADLAYADRQTAERERLLANPPHQLSPGRHGQRGWTTMEVQTHEGPMQCKVQKSDLHTMQTWLRRNPEGFDIFMREAAFQQRDYANNLFQTGERTNPQDHPIYMKMEDLDTIRNNQAWYYKTREGQAAIAMEDAAQKEAEAAGQTRVAALADADSISDRRERLLANPPEELTPGGVWERTKRLGRGLVDRLLPRKPTPFVASGVPGMMYPSDELLISDGQVIKYNVTPADRPLVERAARENPGGLREFLIEASLKRAEYCRQLEEVGVPERLRNPENMPIYVKSSDLAKIRQLHLESDWNAAKDARQERRHDVESRWGARHLERQEQAARQASQDEIQRAEEATAWAQNPDWVGPESRQQAQRRRTAGFESADSEALADTAQKQKAVEAMAKREQAAEARKSPKAADAAYDARLQADNNAKQEYEGERQDPRIRVLEENDWSELQDRGLVPPSKPRESTPKIYKVNENLPQQSRRMEPFENQPIRKGAPATPAESETTPAQATRERSVEPLVEGPVETRQARTAAAPRPAMRPPLVSKQEADQARIQSEIDRTYSERAESDRVQAESDARLKNIQMEQDFGVLQSRRAAEQTRAREMVPAEVAAAKASGYRMGERVVPRQPAGPEEGQVVKPGEAGIDVENPAPKDKDLAFVQAEQTRQMQLDKDAENIARIQAYLKAGAARKKANDLNKDREE